MLTRAADRLETALHGGEVDPGAADDLALAQRLQDLQPRLTPLGPTPAFVNALHQRLLDEPQVAAPDPRATAVRAPEGPRVVTVGGRRGPGLRLAVAGVVGLLAVAGVVGVAGRSALPGQPLYAARELVDRAGVALGGNEQGRGLRLLAVAEHHVDDAVVLASAPSRPTADVRTALTDAGVAAQSADQHLVSDFTARTDPVSLTAIGAFAGRVLPATDRLATSHPDVAETVSTLRASVTAMRDQALRLLTACTACGTATEEARRELDAISPTSGPTTATGPGSSPGPTTSPTTARGGGASLATTGGAPGSSAQPSVTSPAPSTGSGRPGGTTGAGTSGGPAPASPTGSVSPTQGSTPSSSASTPDLPAPTTPLPTLPTLPTRPTSSVTRPEPTIGISATITLGGEAPKAPLP